MRNIPRLGDPRTTQHFRADTPETGRERQSCKDVACPHHMFGWETTVDEGTQLGKAQAGYIRYQSGRRFKEERLPTGLTRFAFYPGQTCFSVHERVIRPAILSQQVGIQTAWRVEPEQWIDGMNEEFYKLGKQKQEG